jgi:hypothetical protein
VHSLSFHIFFPTKGKKVRPPVYIVIFPSIHQHIYIVYDFCHVMKVFLIIVYILVVSVV